MEFVFKRSYRGQIKLAIYDWAGTTLDYGCYAPAVVFIEVYKLRGVEITMEQARAPMGLMKKDHIRAISTQGERMPAKSTYFYPKLLSGLVINPLE